MKKLVIIIVFFHLIAGEAVYSQEVPANIEARLLLKIVSIDENFIRFGKTLKIGVTSDELYYALLALGKIQINKRPFSVEKLKSIEDIKKYSIIYLDPTWKERYTAAANEAFKGKKLLFCSEIEGVEKNKSAIAFVLLEGRPRIVVNLENSKRQGAVFPLSFLEIVIIVK